MCGVGTTITTACYGCGGIYWLVTCELYNWSNVDVWSVSALSSKFVVGMFGVFPTDSSTLTLYSVTNCHYMSLPLPEIRLFFHHLCLKHPVSVIICVWNILCLPSSVWNYPLSSVIICRHLSPSLHLSRIHFRRYLITSNMRWALFGLILRAHYTVNLSFRATTMATM